MVDDLISNLSMEEAAALKRAWPEGVPIQEIALLRATRPDRREAAVERLSILLDLEEHVRVSGTKHAGYQRIAAKLDMGRTGLTKLRTAWQNSRSLASVIHYAAMATPDLYLAARDRSIGKSAASGLSASQSAAYSQSDERLKSFEISAQQITDELRAYVETAVGGNSSISNGEVGRHLLAEFTALKVSRPVAVSLVQRIRREMEHRPDRLADAFGKRVLVDVCAVDLFVDEPGGKTLESHSGGNLAMLSVVMEIASRSILGWSVGPSPSLVLQLLALDQAIAKLAHDGRSETTTIDCSVKVIFVPGAMEALDSLSSTIFPDNLEVALPRLGPRRFGRQLTSLVGARLGKLGLRPGATPPSSDRTQLRWSPIVRTWADAEAFVAAAVGRHQAGVDRALDEMDQALRRTRMAAVRHRLADIRRKLDDMPVD